MPSKSDFLIGLESGSGLAGDIIHDRQHAQELAMRKRAFEQDVALREAQASYALHKRDQRTQQLRQLLELETRMGELTSKPMDETFLQQAMAVWKPNLGLLVSEDPAIRERANDLKSSAEQAFKTSAGFKKLELIAQAQAQGYISPGETDKEKIAEGLNKRDASDLRTYAASKGLDLGTDPAFTGRMSMENVPGGGITPESQARVKSMVDAEALKRKPVDPGDFSVKLNPRVDEFGREVSDGTYTSKNPATDAVLKTLLGKKGVDTDELFGANDRVRVQGPDGRVGTIPKKQVQAAQSQGYKIIQ
jgi:hypothetical protein